MNPWNECVWERMDSRVESRCAQDMNAHRGPLCSTIIPDLSLHIITRIV